MKLIVFLAAALCSGGALAADLEVRFIEGAPKDRFSISIDGACALHAASITIDLATAPAGLLFDVTDQGAGVHVFQPFELTAGHDQVLEPPLVKVGDKAVTLRVARLVSGQSVDFMIDVDDTGDSPTMISGAEIADAKVILESSQGAFQGGFNNKAVAIAHLPDFRS